VAVKRYSVDGIFWNGHGWESVGKDEPTIETALGAASLLLRETHPYQVIIKDREYKTPIPNPAQIIADQLNDMENSDEQNHTLDSFVETDDISEEQV